jgi:hypothetical protein
MTMADSVLEGRQDEHGELVEVRVPFIVTGS